MTLSAWPADVFGFKVVKSPIGTGPTLAAEPNIVLHTTEGNESSDPRPTFVSRGDPPHFAISAKDGGTIWQLRSLDQGAAALRHGTIPPPNDSPNNHALQIEICGFTLLKPWLPSGTILVRVAAVVAYMSQYASCPLRVPNPAWKDDCSDMHLPWAANNSRRQWASQAGRWPKSRGVWGHVEVPWQDPTWHYDPGAMTRTRIIDMALALLKPPPPPGGDDDLTDAQAEMLDNLDFTAKREALHHGLSLAPGSPWRENLAKIRAAAARKTLGVPDGQKTPVPPTVP